MRVQFASIQASVFSFWSERTVKSSVLLWLPDSQPQSCFSKEKADTVGSNIFFSVFHQNLPPFTTSPSCLSWSKCIWWITSQDPVSHVFQCPTFIEFRMARSSWKPSDPTALFRRWALRAGRGDPFPTCPEIAVTKMSSCVCLAWVSWWDCVLGIQDGLTPDWLLKISIKKVTWMKQQPVQSGVSFVWYFHKSSLSSSWLLLCGDTGPGC